ncbi:MAG: hypothetical protein ACT4O6_08775 [Reyranella sp.]
MRKSLSNKAYLWFVDSVPDNTRYIQASTMNGLKARRHWLSGVRRAEIRPDQLALQHKPPLRAAFPFQETLMSDPRSAAEILYPAQNSAAQGAARIELHYLPIAHRGHAFLRFVDANNDVVGELHGLAKSKHTSKIVDMGMDGADLVAGGYNKKYFGEKPTEFVSAVASGSDAEMAKLWAQGQKAADDINAKKFDYKASDLSYEAGTDGGQIQNSNAVAFTLGRAMKLDLDDVVQKAGIARKFPGWARDLLDAKYDRYVAPPVFPVTNAP